MELPTFSAPSSSIPRRLSMNLLRCSTRRKCSSVTWKKPALWPVLEVTVFLDGLEFEFRHYSCITEWLQGHWLENRHIESTISEINKWCLFLHLDCIFIFSGKCTVSSFKDFLSCRPTEMPEENVLLCESRYIESEKQMKKFKGLKRFSLSAKVVEDEIYYFRSVAPFLLTAQVIQIK